MDRFNNINNPDAFERIFQGPLNWVNLVIIAINIIFFGGMQFLGDTKDISFMIKCGAAYTPYILQGEWYRLVTSMFIHFDSHHIFNNMLLLLFLGDMLEGIIGKWRYLLVYLGGGIAGNLLSLYMDCRSGNMPVSAGASGGVYAVIGGIVAVLILNKGRIQELNISRVIFVAMLSLYHGYQSTGIDNAAHLGGFIGGTCICLLICSLAHLFNGRNHQIL